MFWGIPTQEAMATVEEIPPLQHRSYRPPKHGLEDHVRVYVVGEAKHSFPWHAETKGTKPALMALRVAGQLVINHASNSYWCNTSAGLGYLTDETPQKRRTLQHFVRTMLSLENII